MYYRFKISDKSFFEDNPECKAIKIFRDIGDEAMKYIALTYAYNTPLKNIDLMERKVQAMAECGIKKTPTGRPSKLETDLLECRTDDVIAVRDKFLELQYNDALDTYESYEIQLAEFRAFMKKPNKDEKELGRALAISKALPDFLESKKTIAESLNLDEVAKYNTQEVDDIDDDEDYSAIEEFHEK